MPVPSTLAVDEIRRMITQPDDLEAKVRMHAPIRWWWPDDDDDDNT